MNKLRMSFTMVLVWLVLLTMTLPSMSFAAESSFMLSKSSVQLNVGQITQVNALVKLNKTVKNVTATALWSSSNEEVATVRAGKIIALKAGKATVTALYNKNLSASVMVTVTQKETKLLMIKTSEKTFNLEPNANAKVVLTAVYEDGSTKVITSEAKVSVLDETVCTYNAGLIQAVGSGETSINVAYLDQSLVLKVLVKPSLVSLDVLQNTLSLTPGQTVKVTAQGTMSSGSIVDYSAFAQWDSQDPAVVVVDKGLVKAIGVGKTTIQVSSGDLTDYVNVEVAGQVAGQVAAITPVKQEEAPKDGQLRMSSNALTVKAGGEAYALKLYWVDLNGNATDVSGQVVWQVLPPQIIKVESGMLYGISGGNTVLKGEYQGKSIYANVRVNP